jgi:hypothetical protein
VNVNQKDLEEATARILIGFDEACERKIASMKVMLEPSAPAPKVVEREVFVSPADPNCGILLDA